MPLALPQTLEEIPTELLIVISCYLNPKEYHSLLLVNKRFLSILTEEKQNYYKTIYKNDFPSHYKFHAHKTNPDFEKFFVEATGELKRLLPTATLEQMYLLGALFTGNLEIIKAMDQPTKILTSNLINPKNLLTEFGNSADSVFSLTVLHQRTKMLAYFYTRIVEQYFQNESQESIGSWTQLDWASACNQKNAVLSLIKKSPFNRYILGITPQCLKLATIYGHTEIVEILINHHFDSYGKEHIITLGIDLLNKAAKNGHLEIVEKLLTYYDMDSTFFSNQNPLTAAATHGQLEVAKKLLLRRSLFTNEQINYALYSAISHNYGPIVEFLLEYSQDINSFLTPDPLLPSAALLGHVEIVEMLLQKGADVNLRSGSGMTALKYAISGNHLPVVEVLLKYGASTKFPDDKHIVTYAMEQDKPRIVIKLLEHEPLRELLINILRDDLVTSSNLMYFDIPSVLKQLNNLPQFDSIEVERKNLFLIIKENNMKIPRMLHRQIVKYIFPLEEKDYYNEKRKRIETTSFFSVNGNKKQKPNDDSELDDDFDVAMQGWLKSGFN